jgi:hypothetical protein
MFVVAVHRFPAGVVRKRREPAERGTLARGGARAA